MKKQNRSPFRTFIIPLILAVTIFITYFGLLKSFFEQDEWAVFADMIVFGNKSLGEKMSFLFRSSGILSHLIPLTTLFTYEAIQIFGLNYLAYFYLSIGFHICNAIAVYFLSRKLTQNTYISLAAGLIFGIHKLSSQGITWIAASFAGELSTLSFLLSVLFYIAFLQKKRNRYFLGSLLLFVASFLFKETTLSLIVIYPLLYLYFNKFVSLKKTSKDRQVRLLLFFPFVIVLDFILKAVLLIINPHEHPATVGDSNSYPYVLLIRLVLYPLLSLSQIIDYRFKIYAISPYFLKSEYSLIAKSPIAPQAEIFPIPDILYLLASFFVLGVIVLTVLLMRKRRQKQDANLVVVLLLTFFASIVPYVPLPRFSTFMEPRYYYTPNVFSALLVSIIVFYWCFYIFKSRVGKFIFCIVVGMFLFQNYTLIQADLLSKSTIASNRKEILTQLKQQLPSLSQPQNVFYITGIGDDYLIPDLKVPFQSGFGNVLMIEYFDSHKIPASFYDNGFLYQLDDQGYLEKNGYGFGYYYQLSTLQKDMNRYHFKNIHSFSWNQKERKLRPISPIISPNKK